MKRLAIITTHPIQYNAPMFALLSARGRISIKVFYTWGESVLESKFDPGFGKKIEWDIPLLEGYPYIFVKNVSKHPGSHHYSGIDNPTLISDIVEWGADAVLVYGWNFKSHLKAIRHFHKRKPVFFRGDSTLLNRKSKAHGILRRFILKWVYTHIDKAFYVGTHNKEYFKSHGLKDAQLFFAPHAIDNERFYDPEGRYAMEAREWRKLLKIKDAESVLLYAGKLEPVKNIKWLIETMDLLRMLPVKLVIVGNGPLEQELKFLAQHNDRIIFVDFQNQQKMPVVYRLGDILVLSSESETWGLSVNEAMAAERAVLISDRCACSVDLVKNGVNGYTYQSGNREEFVMRVKELIPDKEKLKEMGKQSACIISGWNFEKVCTAIENNL